MSIVKSIVSSSSEETRTIGKNYASNLRLNDIVGLFGNLGSGKTQFVKGVCDFFKVKDIVNSPTFIMVNEYTGLDADEKPVTINHFDLYRLENSKELDEIGIENYLNDQSICLIEWAGLAESYVSGKFNKIYFDFGICSNERIIKIIN